MNYEGLMEAVLLSGSTYWWPTRKDRTFPSAIEFVRNGTICLVRTGDVHAKGLTLWIELI